jgi:hypothetical protein
MPVPIGVSSAGAHIDRSCDGVRAFRALSKNGASTESDQTLRSAPAAARPGARLAGQAVVRENRLFVTRAQLAVVADRGRFPGLFPLVADLRVCGASGCLAQRDEHQPAPSRPADPDAGERRKVGAVPR